MASVVGSVETGKKRVSIVAPCRNEVDAIQMFLDHVLSLDPPEGGYEVIIADGMSNDGTREIIDKFRSRHKNLILLDNSHGTIPHGMNLGIKAANAELIVRTDIRCVHPKDYLTQLLELRDQTQAQDVGGVLEPAGLGYVQESIANAYRSPIAVGGALRDRGEFFGETDTVYGGCFSKKFLLEIGLYDEEMIKNEDDDLAFRIRKAGGKIIQSGKIRVKYFPRKKYAQLFKQFLHYGYWKVPVVRKHPRQASIRHLVPSAFVFGLLLLSMAALLLPARGANWLATYLTTYAICILIEAFRVTPKASIHLAFGTALAMALMHAGYGAGFLLGLAGWIFGWKPGWFDTLSR